MKWAESVLDDEKKILTKSSPDGITIYEQNLYLNLRYFVAIAYFKDKLPLQKLSFAPIC